MKHKPFLSQDPLEIEADQFAVSLLMPAQQVRDIWMKYAIHEAPARWWKINITAALFGVEYDVAEIRLRQLDMIL